MARWWTNQSVLYWIDSSVQYPADVLSAITNWQTAVPVLTYAPASDPLSAHIVFLASTNPPCPTSGGYPALGCATPNIPEDRIWERASYIKQLAVFMYTDTAYYDWEGSGAAARTALWAHELGHANGLAHRYIESTNSCTTEVTIMDRFNVSNKIPSHCDGLTGPAALDTQRVVDYWSKGEAFSFTGAVENKLIVGMWKDLSWTEDSYALGFYYLDQNNDWIMYDWRGMHDDIGIHYLTASRTLAAASDPAAFGAPIPSWQMVCNKPYFAPFNQFGTFRCGPALWVEW